MNPFNPKFAPPAYFLVHDPENLPDAKDSSDAENPSYAENLYNPENFSDAEDTYVTKEDPRYPIVQLRYVELLTGKVNSYKEVMESYKTKDLWVYKFNGKSKTELKGRAKTVVSTAISFTFSTKTYAN